MTYIDKWEGVEDDAEEEAHRYDESDEDGYDRMRDEEMEDQMRSDPRVREIDDAVSVQVRRLYDAYNTRVLGDFVDSLVEHDGMATVTTYLGTGQVSWFSIAMVRDCGICVDLTPDWVTGHHAVRSYSKAFRIAPDVRAALIREVQARADRREN